MRALILFVTAILGIYKCSGQDLKLRRQAWIKCQNNDSVRIRCLVSGYTYAEFKNTLVKDFHDGLVVDSFYLQPEDIDNNDSRVDSMHLKFWGGFGFRYMKVRDTYQFYIPGYPPHIFSNFKMRARTGGYYCYLCEVDQYDLDGVTKKGWELEIIKDSVNIGN